MIKVIGANSSNGLNNATIDNNTNADINSAASTEDVPKLSLE
jgi:hypothetical protein